MKKTDKETKVRSQYRETARMNTKQRNIRLFVLYFIVVLAVISICVVLSLTVLFKIENIQIEGNSFYDSTSIIRESGVTKYQNLYLYRTKIVKQNLCTKFPYIEDIRLERKIPSTLVIHVTEAKEAGIIDVEDRKILISSKNKVLDIMDTAKEGVAIVKGAEVENVQIAQELIFKDQNKSVVLKQIETTLKDQNLTDITYIDVTNLENISLTYQNRIVVDMGKAEEIEKKIEFANSIIKNSSNLANSTGTLDVSNCTSDNKVYFLPSNS